MIILVAANQIEDHAPELLFDGGLWHAELLQRQKQLLVGAILAREQSQVIEMDPCP
jgi:hypothetical protein